MSSKFTYGIQSYPFYHPCIKIEESNQNFGAALKSQLNKHYPNEDIEVSIVQTNDGELRVESYPNNVAEDTFSDIVFDEIERLLNSNDALRKIVVLDKPFTFTYISHPLDKINNIYFSIAIADREDQSSLQAYRITFIDSDNIVRGQPSEALYFSNAQILGIARDRYDKAPTIAHVQDLVSGIEMYINHGQEWENQRVK